MGNVVYLYLTVAFIQMLKAFTPVVTMACLFVAGLESPTRAMIAAVMLTASGTALAAAGEMRLNLLGLMFMFGSELCEAVRLVMTQVRVSCLSCDVGGWVGGWVCVWGGGGDGGLGVVVPNFRELQKPLA
jgi:drug/metabolite transporter (DMT)-like permease